MLRLETGPCSQQLEESRAATKTQSSHTHTHKTQSGTLVSAIFKNGKKENPGNLWLCHFLVLRSPSSLPSLHLFADLFVLYMMSGVFSYTWQEEQEIVCLFQFPGDKNSLMGFGVFFFVTSPGFNLHFPNA